MTFLASRDGPCACSSLLPEWFCGFLPHLHFGGVLSVMDR